MTDDIHLGIERPVLEVNVRRMRYICYKTRFIDFLLCNLTQLMLYFRPVTIHIEGICGKFYCPRTGTINRPAYSSIKDLSPNKSIIIYL